jgi:hypothetical protein
MIITEIFSRATVFRKKSCRRETGYLRNIPLDSHKQGEIVR